MGGLGAVAEPFVVIALLVGGTWINRHFNPGQSSIRPTWSALAHDVEFRPVSPSLLASEHPKWRTRKLRIWGVQRNVRTPNTTRFKDSLLSRWLEKLPFLVECWYWALIYWVYQLGRAATAVWIVEGTVHVARKHAIHVIAAEKHLHIFWELPIQQLFMQNEFVMTWINRIYSFIHIPGSIAFLVWLFYYTTTRNRTHVREKGKCVGEERGSPAGPRLYESRRRTMAFCNLLAFVIFTTWPCMPPRLLSADTSQGDTGKLARSYGFVDTVHGPKGEGSIWTDNRFTNKFAAMPSLHFGYSLLIGVTIATIPLSPAHRLPYHNLPHFNNSHPKLVPKIVLPSWTRLGCVAVGTLYPSIILVAIIATANHFILDAVVGAMVVAVAFWGNDILLNLLVIEDWFLWVLRIHKPENYIPGFEDEYLRDAVKDKISLVI